MARSQYSEEDSQLIAALHALSKKSPKLVKSITYDAPADPSIQVSSWRMNEFKYYQIPSPFPTLARGLFTVEDKEHTKSDTQGYRIIARGYDKFFNIGEVPWTTWVALENHTEAPYTLSLKSNGCIIFIAPLTPSKLVITSKHSLGAVGNAAVSHAQAGEGWLQKYLKGKGRTEADLAKRLWDENLTAVAELCDDSFEEHVLPYPPEKTGLHLHGLNVSTKTFTTLPQSEVDAFAEEWGFIKTESVILNSIQEVQDFTAKVGEEGHWRDEAVEGFVVRTHVAQPPSKDGISPYSPGTSFFFKIKFDEPYMMYRDWRELTKSLLTKGLGISSLPKSKMKRPETQTYVSWVIDEIKRDRSAFEGYTHNHGIIATRERYFKWLNSDQGQKKVADSKKPAQQVSEVLKGKTIIVPVAIPGCGKTSVAVALAHVFDFGHTQSDDIKQKKAAAVFVKNVASLIQKHDVVFADRNNHLQLHRNQLREVASQHQAKLLGLHWSTSVAPLTTVQRVCGDRIVSRGSNHQTLLPDPDNKAHHENVIWQFISNGQEVADLEFDGIIEMNLLDDQETSIRKAINAVAERLDLEKPSEEKIQAAIKISTGYTVSKSGHPPKKAQEVTKKKEKPPRYFAILPEFDVQGVLEKAFASIGDDQGTALWNSLLKDQRVTAHPHITLVHEKALCSESPSYLADKDLWDRCADLAGVDSRPMFSMVLERVIWNERVMVILVDDFRLGSSPQQDHEQKGAQFVSTMPHELRNRLHVTVGTRESSIPPFEGKTLAERWRRGEKGNSIRELDLNRIRVEGRVKGMYA